jgi:hypothetical protein
MLWAADLTRLASTYRECLDQFQTALDFLTSQDREWILGKSLVHALNWPEPASALPLDKMPKPFVRRIGFVPGCQT